MSHTSSFQNDLTTGAVNLRSSEIRWHLTLLACVLSCFPLPACCSLRISSHSVQQPCVKLADIHGGPQADPHPGHFHLPAHLEHCTFHSLPGRLASPPASSPGHLTCELFIYAVLSYHTHIHSLFSSFASHKTFSVPLSVCVNSV